MLNILEDNEKFKSETFTDYINGWSTQISRVGENCVISHVGDSGVMIVSDDYDWAIEQYIKHMDVWHASQIAFSCSTDEDLDDFCKLN